MAINLSPEMNSELRKAVTSFNRKIKRLEQKGVTSSLLPSRVSVRDLKMAYKDSESLNRRLDQLASFTSKGATIRTGKGIVATEAMFNFREQQKQEMIRYYKQQKRNLRSAPIRYKGRTRAYTDNLSAKIKYLAKSSRRRDAKALMIESRNMLTPEALMKKNATFRANYYRTLDEYAQLGNTSRQKVNAIKNKLDSISDEDIYQVILNNPEFDNVYLMMENSADGKDSGVKKSRPRFDEDEINENLDDSLSNIDNIIENTL